MSSSKRNPYVGRHPDLLPAQHRYPPYTRGAPAASRGEKERRAAAEDADDPQTPVHVDISTLTRDEIVNLPRASFTEEEWLDLDDDDREEILDNDPDSQARIQELVDLFTQHAKRATSADDVDSSTIMEQFEYWLADKAGHNKLWEEVPDALYEELKSYASAVLGTEHYERVLDEVLNEVMADNNYYEVGHPARGEREATVIWSEPHHANFYIESSDWDEFVEAPDGTPLMYDDELQRAISEINKEVSDLDLPDDMFEKRASAKGKQAGRWDKWKHSSFDRYWETGENVEVYASWTRIKDAVQEAIDERKPESDEASEKYAELAAKPPEERVVHRWPDGFYVQDLLADELPEEGKIQGMCVGRPDMGYIDGLKKGEIKILSLRRPSGKPLFTFEAELDGEGNIRRIEQIKGKANRLPGFDLGKVGKDFPIKREEVQRVYEFVEGPMANLTGDHSIAIDDIRDAKPAVEQVNDLWNANDKWAIKLLSSLGIEAAERGYVRALPEAPAIENPGARCGLHGEGCTGFCKPYRRRRGAVAPRRGRSNPAPRTMLDTEIAQAEDDVARLERFYNRLVTRDPLAAHRSEGEELLREENEARKKLEKLLERRERLAERQAAVPAQRRSEAQGLRNDRAAAKAHAESLAAILTKHGVPARAWQSPNGATRVYIGGQYLSVSYGGTPSDKDRGRASFLESHLFPAKRGLYHMAMAEYRKSLTR